MLRSLSQEQFYRLAEQGNYVTVYAEFVADTLTPIAALECLAQPNQPAILLESGIKFREQGSYSFIGIHPYASFATKSGVTTVTAGKEPTQSQQPPLPLLRNFYQQFRPVGDEASQLSGQMMGFFAYDAARYFEELPNRHQDDAAVPDILFHFYTLNLIFNHDTNTLMVVVTAKIEGEKAAVYERAMQDIQSVITQLKQSSPTVTTVAQALTDAFSADCDDALFEQKVQQAKSYIQAGDAFQIVLSRTFSKPLTAAPLSVYRVLRHSNPTPYMYYLTTPDFTLFGASPEKLVSLHDQEVTIVPIAGTVPVNGESNEALLQKLRTNEKECAEHTMLIDLARNDIGAVCEPGSVVVKDIMQGQRLTHVMHMVSYVKGKIASQYDAFDLIKKVFPAGTLSGTPKIRAMEIIDELEASRRYLYGGAICKIDMQGNLDSCIIIRSGMVKNGMIQVRAGAGVVFDSQPADEAAETRHKAKGVLTAVAQIEGGAA